MCQVIIQCTGDSQQAAAAAGGGGGGTWQQETGPAGHKARLELLKEGDKVLVELLALAAGQHLLLQDTGPQDSEGKDQDLEGRNQGSEGKDQVNGPVAQIYSMQCACYCTCLQ